MLLFFYVAGKHRQILWRLQHRLLMESLGGNSSREMCHLFGLRSLIFCFFPKGIPVFRHCKKHIYKCQWLTKSLCFLLAAFMYRKHETRFPFSGEKVHMNNELLLLLVEFSSLTLFKCELFFSNIYLFLNLLV